MISENNVVIFLYHAKDEAFPHIGTVRAALSKLLKPTSTGLTF